MDIDEARREPFFTRFAPGLVLKRHKELVDRAIADRRKIEVRTPAGRWSRGRVFWVPGNPDLFVLLPVEGWGSDGPVAVILHYAAIVGSDEERRQLVMAKGALMEG